MNLTATVPRAVQRGKACVHDLVGACLLAALLVLTGLLAGCSGSASTSSSGPPPIGPLPQIRTASDLVLPLDHYVGSWRDRITLETAREELVSRCMAAKGYPGYPVADYSAHLLQPRTGNRFGVIDEREAATNGFLPSWVGALETEGADLTERFDGWSGADIDVALRGEGGSAATSGSLPTADSTDAPDLTGQ